MIELSKEAYESLRRYFGTSSLEKNMFLFKYQYVVFTETTPSKRMCVKELISHEAIEQRIFARRLF
jgi:hypothetical protein